jgi:hypothetical protein
MVHLLKNFPVCFLYDHLDSKLVTVKKPSKKEISSTQAETSEVVPECIWRGQ